MLVDAAEVPAEVVAVKASDGLDGIERAYECAYARAMTADIQTAVEEAKSHTNAVISAKTKQLCDQDHLNVGTTALQLFESKANKPLAQSVAMTHVSSILADALKMFSLDLVKVVCGFLIGPLEAIPPSKSLTVEVRRMDKKEKKFEDDELSMAVKGRVRSAVVEYERRRFSRASAEEQKHMVLPQDLKRELIESQKELTENYVLRLIEYLCKITKSQLSDQNHPAYYLFRQFCVSFYHSLFMMKSDEPPFLWDPPYFLPTDADDRMDRLRAVIDGLRILGPSTAPPLSSKVLAGLQVKSVFARPACPSNPPRIAEPVVQTSFFKPRGPSTSSYTYLPLSFSYNISEGEGM